MTDQLDALRSSVQRLRSIVEPLTPDQLVRSAYPSEWTVADVLSHVGSGAVILERRLDDTLADRESDPDFAPSVWDSWNARSPEAQAADALVADAALLARIDAVTDDERAAFEFAMGPMTFDFDGYVGLRVNEHAFHTWDVEVTFDPDATVAADVTPFVVDRLEMIARFTGKPDGTEHTVRVRTTAPARDVDVVFGADSVVLTRGDGTAAPDLELPAEAFARLVYGRLDPGHAPAVAAPAVLGRLRATFPGV